MQVDVKLSGFNDFSKLLKDLPNRVENKVVQSAVNVAMREGRNEIARAAPDRKYPRSAASKKYGSLRKNLKVLKLRRVRKGQKGARIDTGKAFWGQFYEFGTRYQPARPWFGPAFAKASELILKRLYQAVGAGIEREATRK